jgi:hypothetical protein
MGLISTTIPNLVNGVSQQPYALRLASQCQEQVNGYASVVEGLRKRPGTRHIARLTDIAPGGAFSHTINRDSTEQYIIMVANGDLVIFDFMGNQKFVSFPNGKAYLASLTPQDVFRCVTVADYTFLLNTSTVTRKATTLSPKRNPEALVWVKQGSYGAKYTVFVDGVSRATFTAPDGSVSTHVSSVTTDNIAEQLRSQLASGLGAAFLIERIGSTIWIRRANGADFTIQTDDSIGDSGLVLIKEKIQRFSQLPARAVDGFTVEIAGDQSSAFDNYFVTYSNDGAGTGAGTWKEAVKGGELEAINPSTMPHALLRNSDGTFTFQVLEWASRAVGDLDSNPFPSFIDSKINDVYFHRNRLGFIADENVCLSRAGSYFNFFRGTATAVLDDDPIDVGTSHVKVSILRHAIPFNETLLLFSDKTQFQLGSAEILTPETISINQTTEYECSLRAKPVGVGRFVYFAVNRGAFTGIREYFVNSQTEATDAYEVTGHVPKYLPGGVFKLAASGNEDILVALSDQAPNQIFVYKYYWGGPEKLQSAWSRWTFSEGDKILNCDFIESRLYILVQRADGYHLEVLNLEPGATEADWDIAVHLDRAVTEQTATAITFEENDPTLEGDNVTHVRLPYLLEAGALPQIVVAPGGTRSPGVIFGNFTAALDVATNTTVLSIAGDWRSQPFFMGLPYTFRYRFSTLVIKEESVGGGQMTVGEGRIQLRRITLLYNNSGYFRVEVTPFRRNLYNYIFSGRVVGSGSNLIGKVSVEEGRFTFPVASKNEQVLIEIVNDSFLPCFFLSAEWEAFYTIRSQRL